MSLTLEQWVEWLDTNGYVLCSSGNAWVWNRRDHEQPWSPWMSLRECASAIIADAKARGITIRRTDEDRHAAGYGLMMAADGRWRARLRAVMTTEYQGTLDECRAAIDAEMDKAGAQKARPTIAETMAAVRAAGGHGWDGVADPEAEIGRESLIGDVRTADVPLLVSAEGLCNTATSERRFLAAGGMILSVTDEFETAMRGWP